MRPLAMEEIVRREMPLAMGVDAEDRMEAEPRLDLGGALRRRGVERRNADHGAPFEQLEAVRMTAARP